MRVTLYSGMHRVADDALLNTKGSAKSVALDDDARHSDLVGRKYLLSFDIPSDLTVIYQ